MIAWVGLTFQALLLTSQMGRHHDNISWVKFLLDTAKVRYEELNCDLPENKDARSRYGVWGLVVLPTSIA